MTAINVKTITFSCSEDLDKELREYCEFRRWSISDFIRELVKKEIKKDK